MNNRKKDNVVGIGHNNNVSKEQYAKVVNKLHRVLKYSQQEIRRVERFLDQAFTKYPFSNPYQPKLKEFEVHEARAEGKDTASRYKKITDADIQYLEAKAKAEGIELELNKSEESDED